MTFAPTCLNYRAWIVLSLLVLLGLAQVSQAQTTAFTYQGKLADGQALANGSYDLQFKVFDTDTVGTGAQQGGAVSRPAVQVTDGIFTVQLDFGAGVFPGAERFLEVAVKQAGGTSYTTLAPRQPVSSTPYAIRSLNAAAADGLSAACVNCITSSQILNVQGAQITGAIAGSQINGLIPVASVPPGSTNYIQNTNSPQAPANFNINGNGTAGGALSGNVVNSATVYKINNNPVLSLGNAGSLNTLVGLSAGGLLTTGNANTFFGQAAGTKNTSGSANSFFGQNAGGANTTTGNNTFFGYASGAANIVCCNSFFGTLSGAANTTGTGNAFFGHQSGTNNATGLRNTFFGFQTGSASTVSDNSFFGYQSGTANTNGQQNAFYGSRTGQSNTTGSGNAFFGYNAGTSNTTAESNAFFGYQSGASNTTGAFNTFVGANTGVDNITGSNNTFSGDFAGFNNTSGNSNTFIGVTAGKLNQTGSFNAFFGVDAGLSIEAGIGNTFIGHGAASTHTLGDRNTALGQNTVVADGVTHSTAVGANASVSTSNTIVLGTSTDRVVILGLGSAGSTQLCRNAANQIATCSSSLRYKTDLQPFAGGLALINRLNPITFRWKTDNQLDLGFGAEEVAAVEPLLITRNAKGEVEGVKYDRISAALVNAIKEQQQQIEQQQKQIDELRLINAENIELKAQIAAVLARLEQNETRRAEGQQR